MKAIVQDVYGGADVLRFDEIDRPRIGDGEVLLRVHAAGVERSVWHLMTGLPYPVRLAGYGVRAPDNPVRGREVAGQIEEIGRNVAGLSPGDEVFGIAEGSFAEYARADAGKIVLRPPALGVEQAATIGISGLTALQAVRDRAKVKDGQKVLVIGAAGAVGTFAVQIAKAFGAHVTGVCSTTKVDLVRSLGADHVIDYRRDDIGDDIYDAILDIGGNRSLKRLRRALTPRGTLVIVGGETGGRWLGGTDRQIRALLLSPFVRQTLGSLLNSENAADMAVLAELVVSGKVTPAIDRTFALVDAPAAIRHMTEGRVRGKAVVSVAG
jgi:NADPH:quinone reductase-like Zn-dependent oxidoreductase